MADFRRWRIDTDQSGIKGLACPPGFDASGNREQRQALAASRGDEIDKVVTVQMKQSALFARAAEPLKMVGMMAFMMWMSGSQLHIFSIMTTLSGVYQPLMAILNSGQVFKEEDEEGEEPGRLDAVTPRALYCSIQMAGLLFALYRLNGMGLLPTHTSDFASALLPPRALEFSGGGSVA